MTPLLVGVVGTGHIGKLHARVYSELGDAGVKLAAVYDTDPHAAGQIAGLYGARVAASMEFANLVDAATISTPTPTHFPLAKLLLERGKHLLVEKPITENTADARALSELAHAKGCVLQVGHIERFNPAFGALEALLTKPKFIEAHRLSPYPQRSTEIGVVLDLMIHDLEIILHLVRSPLAQYRRRGRARAQPGRGHRQCAAAVRGRLRGQRHRQPHQPEKMRKIRVFQEDAYLSLDYQNQSGEIYRRGPAGIARERPWRSRRTSR